LYYDKINESEIGTAKTAKAQDAGSLFASLLKRGNGRNEADSQAPW
jgi:hypothetical protein